MSSPVALVTGASSGIGRAVASMLCSEGHALVICARREEELDELAAELRDLHGRNVLVRKVDLVDLNDVSAIVPEVLEHFGRLDVLINNAGMLEKSMLSDMPMGFIQRAMAVHAISPTILVRDAWGALSEADRGVVINVSSVSTLSPFPGLAAYGMSKQAIEGLTRSIHADAIDQGNGIVSLALAPGAVDTQALRCALDGAEAPGDAIVPMEEVASFFLACVRGEWEALAHSLAALATKSADPSSQAARALLVCLPP